MIKGSDPLCPLGFHPQVRWPTRCKRCFREYTEHKLDKKNKEAERRLSAGVVEGWSGSLADPTSTGYGAIASAYDSVRSMKTNLSNVGSRSSFSLSLNHEPDWRQSTPSLSTLTDTPISNSGNSTPKVNPPSTKKPDPPPAPKVVAPPPAAPSPAVLSGKRFSTPGRIKIESFKEVPSLDEDTDNPDVAFIIKHGKWLHTDNTVKASAQSDSSEEEADDDTTSIYTDATDATLRDPLADPSDSELKKEVEQLRQKCLTLEREKSELVDMQAVTFEGSNTKPTAKEMFRLKKEIEDYKTKLKSLEHQKTKSEREMSRCSAQAQEVEGLREKLAQSQTMVERLMEATDEQKKQIEAMESEMQEMHDTIRDDEVDAYHDMKKELEQTAKNCRILQFKLRKTERRVETVQIEKDSLEKKVNELQDTPVNRGKETRMAPPSDEASQLLRDLTEALEREADMREQLKFSEDEATNLRSTLSRMEEDNESMSIQLKKLAESKGSFIPGILRNGHEEDVNVGELKMQLELNDREAGVLRKKVEDIENERNKLNREVKDLRDKVSQFEKEREKSLERPKKLTKQKSREEVEQIEAEIADLRRKLIDKERENERLHAEISVKQQQTRKGSLQIGGLGRAGMMQRSRSLDSEMLDARKQLQISEQEASLLRSKIEGLEKDNEKLSDDNRRLSLTISKKPTESDLSFLIDKQEMQDRLKELEEQLKEAKSRANEAGDNYIPIDEHSKQLEELRKEVEGEKKGKEELQGKLKTKEEEMKAVEGKANIADKAKKAVDEENIQLRSRIDKMLEGTGFEERTAKQPTSTSTRPELRKMVDELEQEIGVLYTRLKDNESEKLKKELESEKTEKEKMQKSLKEQEDKYKKEIEETQKKQEEINKETQKEKERADKAEKEKKKVEKEKTKLEKEKEKVEKEKEKLTEEKSKAEAEKEKATKAKEEMEKEKAKIENEKQQIEKEKQEEMKQKEEVEKSKQKIEKEKETAVKEKEQLGKEKEKLEKEKEKVEKEKAELEKTATANKKGKKDEELKIFKERIDVLKKDLSAEKDKRLEIQGRMDSMKKSGKSMEGEVPDTHKETLKIMEEEKEKLQEQLKGLKDQVSQLEKKAKEVDEKQKKKTKELQSKINGLEKELAEEKEKVKTDNSQQPQSSDANAEWTKEKEELKKKLEEVTEKVQSLEGELEEKKKQLEEKEKSLKEEHEKSLSAAKKEHQESLEKEQKELGVMQTKLKEMETKLSKTEKDLKTAKEKQQKAESEVKKEKEETKKKISDMEYDVKSEQKKREKLEKELRASLQNKEAEVASLQHIVAETQEHARRNLRVENQEELQETIEALEEQLTKEHQEYEDLTAKYELLEEDYVMIKARLVMEKEQVESNHNSLKNEYETLDGELKTLRETFNLRQDTWIKEKLDLQEKLKEAEERLARGINDKNVDAIMLQRELGEKNVQIEQMKKEEDMMKDQVATAKKECDEYKKKLEDYDQISRIQQRSLSIDTTNLEKEIRDLRNKFQQEEKAHKSEIAGIKMNQDAKEALLKEEVAALQMQSGKFRRERDTYREMMEGAQRTISELKSDTITQQYGAGDAEKTELEDKIRFLQEQTSSLEDRLAEARMENIKMTTERTTDRVTWECKMAQLQTRVNEMEEDKIMLTGRSRVAGTRSRIELAWQKERCDHMRLLEELTTSNKDLQGKLLDLEQERDSERRESGRKLEELRSSVEEEKKEARQAIRQLQHDVVTLRDAQSKSRMMNDRLRRERERLERDREEQRAKVSDMADQQLQLEEQLNYMKDLVPKIVGEPTKAKAETKKLGTSKATKQDAAAKNTAVKELTEGLDTAFRVLKEERARREFEDSQARMSSKRVMMPYRRTVSAGPEEMALREEMLRKSGGAFHSSTRLAPPPTILTPNRRAVSYEHDIDDPNAELGYLYPSEEGGSATSIQSYSGYRLQPTYPSDRELSSDRGSTKSEMTPQAKEKKKKKGIVGKIKSLTKSRSTEETEPPTVPGGYHAMYTPPTPTPSHGYESDVSIDEEGKKKSVKSKLSSVFSSKKSHSRPASTDRESGFSGSEKPRSLHPSPSPEPHQQRSSVRPLGNRRIDASPFRRQGSAESHGSVESFAGRRTLPRQGSNDSTGRLARQSSVETEV